MPETKEERIYCSGPNWEGDGSKTSAACKFGDSMVGADRYKCSRCISGQTPENADGIKNREVEKALEITPQVQDEELISIEPIESVVRTKSDPPKLPKSIRRKKRRRF